MSARMNTGKKLIAVAVASALLIACATTSKPEGADNVRAKLTQLQSDPQLASRAPVAIKDAEEAVRAAEVPQKSSDAELGKHLVFIADRKIDTASALAQQQLLVDQRKTLSEQRETARLDSRTQEADAAKIKSADLQKQLDELNAKKTDRGIVVTLGDVLFDTGKSDLKGGALANLGKLASVLNQYPDRTVVIEGHTDSVGSDDYNLGLSQRRADAVRVYLVSQGVASSRLEASGKGKGSPVAGNDTATGRQQNRRVEVIISNAEMASK